MSESKHKTKGETINETAELIMNAGVATNSSINRSNTLLDIIKAKEKERVWPDYNNLYHLF